MFISVVLIVPVASFISFIVPGVIIVPFIISVVYPRIVLVMRLLITNTCRPCGIPPGSVIVVFVSVPRMSVIVISMITIELIVAIIVIFIITIWISFAWFVESPFRYLDW